MNRAHSILKILSFAPFFLLAIPAFAAEGDLKGGASTGTGQVISGSTLTATPGTPVVCPICQSIADELAKAEAERERIKKELDQLQKEEESNQTKETEIEKRIKQLEDRFNKLMESEAQSTDPAGTKITSRYTPDGDIQAVVTYPDGRTETRTPTQSKTMKSLKNQIDASKSELQDLRDRMHDQSSKKTNLEQELQAIEAKITTLQKELEECLKKCRIIVLDYDSTGCGFGGGTIQVSVPPESPVDIKITGESGKSDSSTAGTTVSTAGTGDAGQKQPTVTSGKNEWQFKVWNFLKGWLPAWVPRWVPGSLPNRPDVFNEPKTKLENVQEVPPNMVLYAGATGVIGGNHKISFDLNLLIKQTTDNFEF